MYGCIASSTILFYCNPEELITCTETVHIKSVGYNIHISHQRHVHIPQDKIRGKIPYLNPFQVLLA